MNTSIIPAMLTGQARNSSAKVIAFEDSPNGVTAAKHAGLYCVAIPNPLTSQLYLDHADLQLDSLEDLTLEDLIARVEKERD